MMSKIIPKSVLKIGVKLPDAKPNPDSGQSPENAHSEMTLDSVLSKFSLSDNPFVKHDKKLFGRTLFRPKFTRFGHAHKGQWQQPPPEFDNPIDEVSFTQRERVRKELAAILKGARSTLDLDNVTMTPKMILESRSEEFKLESWPSAPSLVAPESPAEPEPATRGSHCVKCARMVYPLEKIEPMAGYMYHPQCFKCVECHTKLTVATFCRSLHSNRDLQVYCRAHQPRQDKVMLCKFNARKSNFPAFKLSWQTTQSTNTSAVPNVTRQT